MRLNLFLSLDFATRLALLMDTSFYVPQIAAKLHHRGICDKSNKRVAIALAKILQFTTIKIMQPAIASAKAEGSQTIQRRNVFHALVESVDLVDLLQFNGDNTLDRELARLADMETTDQP